MSIPNLSGNALPLAAAQKQQASALLGRAFYPDPIMNFILPEDAARARVLPWYLGKALNYALMYGEVYTDAQLRGVIGWLPPGHTLPSVWRYIRAGFLPVRIKLGQAGYRRMQANEEYIDAVHAAQMPQPHWYLWFVAVEPAAQRHGVGSMLIRHKLAQADASHLPCYLETHNPNNVPFYEKLGFRVLHHGQIPGSEVQMWGMG